MCGLCSVKIFNLNNAMKYFKNEIVKNFSIGFIPIAVFLAADFIYGPVIGIAVALLFGLLELLFVYIKNKAIEKFIVFDMILLGIFGLVSIVLENAFFFKIKPAVFEFIFVILLGINGFTNKPILLLLSKRYMAGLNIQTAQLEIIKKVSAVLSIIFAVHTFFIVWSAYYWSKEVWAFISGGLFYIIFGLIFLGQFIYLRYRRRKKTHGAHAKEEWFDIVDEQGRVLDKALRSVVHGNPRLIHPTVHLHVFNRKGHLFLQKRVQSKDLFPGMWDTAVGGHINSGEPVHQALLRETKEELGIDAGSARPLFKYLMRNSWESELIHTFKMVYEGPFKLAPDEIDEGRFWSVFEIRKNIGQGLFTPNFEQEFKMLQKAGLL